MFSVAEGLSREASAQFSVSLAVTFVNSIAPVDSLCVPFRLPTAVYLATLGCVACGGLRLFALCASALRYLRSHLLNSVQLC